LEGSLLKDLQQLFSEHARLLFSQRGSRPTICLGSLLKDQQQLSSEQVRFPGQRIDHLFVPEESTVCLGQKANHGFGPEVVEALGGIAAEGPQQVSKDLGLGLGFRVRVRVSRCLLRM
jgi:hypothetical protein